MYRVCDQKPYGLMVSKTSMLNNTNGTNGQGSLSFFAMRSLTHDEQLKNSRSIILARQKSIARG